MIIPYSRNESGFKILDLEKNYLYCSLDFSAVEKLTKEETIKLRDYLENVLSEKENKKMELGQAELAVDKYGSLVALCYFKESGHE